MKKIIKLFFTFLIISILFIQCKKEESIKIPKRKLDPFLEEIFIKKFPNFKENDLVKEKALDQLNKKIDSLYPLKYLEDIPLKIFKIQKNKNGKGAIVQFYADNKDETNNILTSDVGFDVIGLMDEKLASTLSANNIQTYYIRGHNYKRMDKTMISVLVDMTYYSPTPEISTELYGINNINLGNFICEIDSIR